MCRGENFDFQMPLEPISPPTHTLQKTRTSREFEHRNPFRSQGSIVQEDLVLKPLYHKWPSVKVFQLKLAHQHFCIHLFPSNPLKTLNPVQQVRWMWGTIRSPIFSVGAFSLNKPFLTPNSDVLTFGLSRHWTHRLFGSVTILQFSRRKLHFLAFFSL